MVGAGAIAATGTAKAATGNYQKKEPRKQNPIEWRNKQAVIAYRQLRNTGLMISEIVQRGSRHHSPLAGLDSR